MTLVDDGSDASRRSHGEAMATVEASALIEATVSVVCAYVSKNAVTPGELPGLVGMVHGSLKGMLALPVAPAEPEAPAMQARKAVRKDAVGCMCCGKWFKSLKRHLLAHHGLTPAEYRARWGLPDTHPMVAPLYAERRSELAYAMGLGSQRRHDRKGVPDA